MADVTTHTSTSTPQVWTVKKIAAWSLEYLSSKSVPTSRLDVDLLLCKALDCERLFLYTNADRPLSIEELAAFKSLLKRRSLHEPIAYILEAKEFINLKLKVNSNVLIPRPETELLTEMVINAFDQEAELAILDIGTGSGCIAIALGQYFRKSKITSWDISPQALELANSNALSNKVENCNFELRDALNKDTWEQDQRFDIIVSNPPYISESETELLTKSVIDFEPRSALFGEEDGLRFYRVFAENYRNLLNPNGTIFMEVGFKQAKSVADLFTKNGWKNGSITKDYSGIERFVKFNCP